MNIPKDVCYIIESIEKHGFEAFIVGGCVRDYIISNSAKDWDITTNALPEQIKEIFSHTVDTGIKHGTVTIVLNRNNYEVTTYRIDGEYIDNRHPDQVIFTTDLEQDLSRRDFTMNAIAYNLQEGYVDPFFGLKDIEKKLIRGVGDADKRFKEDALRMMRGIRFASQLGFEIEKNTFNAIYRNRQLIKNISVERIREEFLKLIKSDFVEKIYLLNESGLLYYILPEIDYFFNNFKKNVSILKFLDKDLRLIFLLCHLDERRGVDLLKRFKFDNKTINEIKIILRYFNDNFIDDRIETRKTMSKIQPEIFKKIISIKFAINRIENNLIQCKMFDNIYDEIEDVLRKSQCYSLKDLAINGNDLKEIGFKDGKLIGQALAFALSIVLESPEKNNCKDLFKLIQEKYKLFNNR